MRALQGQSRGLLQRSGEPCWAASQQRQLLPPALVLRLRGSMCDSDRRLPRETPPRDTPVCSTSPTRAVGPPNPTPRGSLCGPGCAALSPGQFPSALLCGSLRFEALAEGGEPESSYTVLSISSSSSSSNTLDPFPPPLVSFLVS